MSIIRKYGQSFLLGITFCTLFFVLTFPCSAQEAAGVDGKAGTAQAADSSPGTGSELQTADDIVGDSTDDE